LKTVVRKDLWVRVPRPPQTGSNQGFRFHRIEVLGALFDPLDGFKTVVQIPDWSCRIDVTRRLIRTFADFIPTEGRCNGLSSIKPFPETVLLQARNFVDLHVRDPPFPALGELSTDCQRLVVLETCPAPGLILGTPWPRLTATHGLTDA
jgi:hypothetical protein